MSSLLRHGRVFAAGRDLLDGACRLDHSTSVPDLGSLFERAGDKPLQRLKRDLAEAYGMAWSFPSTHGTTMLNVLALLTACPPGGRVLVNRDAHVSMSAALIHGDFQPVFLTPEYDDQLGLSLGPTAQGVRDLLARERVDCVFLTSPNYFGLVGELPEAIAAGDTRYPCAYITEQDVRRVLPALGFDPGESTVEAVAVESQEASGVMGVVLAAARKRT